MVTLLSVELSITEEMGLCMDTLRIPEWFTVFTKLPFSEKHWGQLYQVSRAAIAIYLQRSSLDFIYFRFKCIYTNLCMTSRSPQQVYRSQTDAGLSRPTSRRGRAPSRRPWERICIQTPPDCWQVSRPCGCRTELLISFLEASHGHSQLPGATRGPWLSAPFLGL